MSGLKNELKKNRAVVAGIRSLKKMRDKAARFFNRHIFSYLSPSSKYIGAPKHELWTWADVEAYVKRKRENGDKTVFLEKLHEQEIHFPPPVFTLGTPAPEAALVAEKTTWYCEYVCMFSGARISMRDFNVITQDDYLVQPVSNYYGYRSRSHVVYTKLKLPLKKRIAGRTLCLKAWGNAYHILHDAACAIKLIQDAGIDIDSIDNFLVFDYKEDWYNKVYSKLGLPRHKIINGDAKHAYTCEQLLITSYYEHHGAWYGNFLKQVFLPAVPVRTSYGKKLFISRAKTAARRVINEEEVISFLSKKGFSTVFCEDLTMEEQASVYHEAECIVAPHGANLVNILFCKPGTKVCEIRYAHHAGYYKKLYFQVAADCGLRYFLLYAANGRLSGNRDINDADMYVDVKELETMLCTMNIDN